ncbi:hypothetical protein [Pedosphaera parvula]|uniref:Uncharacterized protein n=1 Tax=Pedosphaera parvula (strain Ellin514) TaxID=320771 RepID=B9XLH2_PEDPL|nr:hypothetical protein [Pedosphaera parvula]EEF59375.1 hypothetical protein Cflav_PD1923 [Pedosphaera parvula Ellin514]
MGTLDLSGDGKAIVEYMKAFSHTFVSGREIARRAGGKKRYAEDRFWAMPILSRLVEEGVLESDNAGRFRLVQERPQNSKNKLNRHVAPQMLRILKSSGREFQTFDLGDYEEPPAIPPYPQHLLPDKHKTPPPSSRDG